MEIDRPDIEAPKPDVARLHGEAGNDVAADAYPEPDYLRRGVRWGVLTSVAAAAVAGTWAYRRFGRKTSD